MNTQTNLNWIANFIWGIADDVLRDVYVRGKYRDVILPMVVIRRLDAVLEPTKPAVLAMKATLDKAKVAHQEAALKKASGQAFYNASPFTLRELKNRGKASQLKADFEAYLDGFSDNVKEILGKFKFHNQIPTLHDHDLIGALIEKFLDRSINLSPLPVKNEDGSIRLPALDNHAMGTVFEELIRRFNEENNEEAGEHFTPRDVVALMADLIFMPIAKQIKDATYTVYRSEIKRRSRGVVESRLRLYSDDLFRMPLLVPPPAEQAGIVRFLGAVDRKVNRFIRAKRRLIEVLTEQKQAIITHAVTKGLNPHAPLKPSGIDWFGDVPEHWEVMPLRRRCAVIDCKHVTVGFVEDGIPLASVREVQTFDLSLGKAKRTTSDWYEKLIEGDRRPRRGDIIYCRNVSVGAAAIVNTDEPCAMGQDVCLIRSKENPRYINYFLHSALMDRQLSMVLVGSTFDRINVAEVKALTVVFPPKSEQDGIVAHLDGAIRSFDAAIAVIKREIDLIREYRTRLVADVVTGKVDVRAAAAALPDEPPENAHVLEDAADTSTEDDETDAEEDDPVQRGEEIEA